MTRPHPCVSLVLDSRPQTLTLVRTMLSGFADALALDADLLDDLKTAVSEACNNVVLHAYPEAEEGPLEVELRLDGPSLVAEVRDAGRGIEEPVRREEDRLGLGIPVIQALAERSELRPRPEGGTEVRMHFAAEREGVRLYALPGPVAANDDFSAQLDGDAVISASPPPVVGAVLCRLARALAAAARFSLDRFSDVYLVCDALVDAVAGLSPDGRLSGAVTAGPQRIAVALGPLPAGSGEQITRAPGAPSPLQRLSDELHARPAGEERELLELVILDRPA